jgi:F-type H+-transporting ATPase subunit epsilon
MSFQCVVVTPEQQVLDESCTQVILPAFDGEIGILTGRAPLLAKLGVGVLRVDLAGGQKRAYFIDGGIAQMKDNRLTVLTTEATVPSDIDAEAARGEYNEATARKITDQKSFEDRQRALARGRIKQELASRR